jgi:glycerol-3-phosphate acyltransferase PlsX
VDVVVTDGFTGNVVLKSIEGSLQSLAGAVFEVLHSTEEAREASKVVMPLLLSEARYYEPDYTGGALLLGIDGVCVISHGASSALAILHAARTAMEMVQVSVVERIKEALTDAG